MSLIMSTKKSCLRKTSPRLCLLVISALFFIIGMTRAPKPEKANLKDAVSAELSQIETTYASENLPAFITFLDKAFEGFGDFKDSLQDEFLNKKNLELKFIVDSILEEDDKILVKLHWFKKYTDPSGKLLKVKGESQFVFFRDSEGLKLLSIRGNNPFF